MEEFFYLFILTGGSALAYYIVFVVGKKIAPVALGTMKLPKAITFVLQFFLPALLIPLLAPYILKNIDKMYNITKGIGESPYLSVITKVFEGAENTDRLWAIISLFLFFEIFKNVIENMPNGPASLGGFGMALAIVIITPAASAFLWELVGEKIWIRAIEFFQSLWWDTIPGNIIREWLFPEAVRITP